MGQIIEFNNRGLRHTIEKNSRIVNLLIVNYIVNFERQYVAKRSCRNVQYLLKDRENKHRIQISGTYAAGRIIVFFSSWSKKFYKRLLQCCISIWVQWGWSYNAQNITIYSQKIPSDTCSIKRKSLSMSHAVIYAFIFISTIKNLLSTYKYDILSDHWKNSVESTLIPHVYTHVYRSEPVSLGATHLF